MGNTIKNIEIKMPIFIEKSDFNFIDNFLNKRFSKILSRF